MRIGVMQMVDSLLIGGAERTGVTLANLLPRDRYRNYLCTTRCEGELAQFVSTDVGRLRLWRKGRVDFGALGRIRQFIRDNRIHIIHAHASSLFFARLAAAGNEFPKLVWHDHYGRCEMNDRPAWLYRMATSGADGVISVNEQLAEWARSRLKVPADRVRFIRNGVQVPVDVPPAVDLPGTPGRRVLCVANLRPQKDHTTLFQAMQQVIRDVPDAYLLLAGETSDVEYRRHILGLIPRMGLQNNVSHIGARTDIAAVMKACDIAVLSSISEGLPLVLLEFGTLGQPVVCTEVGQCPEVVDQGQAGVLVPPQSPEKLAHALVCLLRSPDLRRSLGEKLRRRVNSMYSSDAIVSQVSEFYDVLLNTGRGVHV